MITSLTSRNHQDFSRRYGGTYGWFHKDDGTKLLVSVDAVYANEVRFSYNDMEFFAYADSGAKFEFIPVNKGLFNGMDGQVYFYSRHPARQWKRGIHPDNTIIRVIGSVYGVNVNWANLSQVFTDGYNPFAKVDHTKRPVALNHIFAIDKNNKFVFYDKEIGEVKNNIIYLNSPMLQQEVTDMINRMGYPMKVEVVNV